MMRRMRAGIWWRRRRGKWCEESWRVSNWLRNRCSEYPEPNCPQADESKCNKNDTKHTVEPWQEATARRAAALNIGRKVWLGLEDYAVLPRLQGLLLPTGQLDNLRAGNAFGKLLGSYRKVLRKKKQALFSPDNPANRLAVLFNVD